MIGFSTEALSVALAAAAESTRDLKEFTLPYEERGDRNEQWTHSYVSCRLNDAVRSSVVDSDGIYVTYEARASWLAAHTGATSKRGPKSFRGAERFDIAVWNSDGLLEGIVEIKDAPAMDQKVFPTDTDRVCRALNRWGSSYGGSLSWGLVLFNCRLSRAQLNGDISAELRSQFDRRILSIKSKAGKRVAETGYVSVCTTSKDCCVGWGAALIV